MASISSPEHSFVQINPPAKSPLTCEPDDTCLPIISLGDLSFQIKAYPDIDYFLNENYRVRFIGVPCANCGQYDADDIIEMLTTNTEQVAYIFSEPIQLKSETGNPYIYAWLNQYAYPNNIEGCFMFCVWMIVFSDASGNTPVESDENECLGVSNCFKVITDHCFSTKLSYSGNEDGLGYIYELHDDEDIYNEYQGENIIRLPMFLRDPQFPGEEKGYQKSDGTFKKLSERINEQWNLETGWMPYDWHKKLRVALSHDNIQVQNFNKQKDQIAKNVYRSEGYEIQWPEIHETHNMAKASTKLFISPMVASVNSNCI